MGQLFAASPSSPVLHLRSRSVEELHAALRAPASGSLPLRRVSHGWVLPEDVSDGALLKFLSKHLPDDVVFAGELAAAIHGVDVRPQGQGGEPFRLCLMRRAGHRALRRPGIHCRSMQIVDEDVVERFGVRVTSAGRTLADVVCSSALDRAVASVEGFLQRRLVTLKHMWWRVQGLFRRRGVKMLRRALRLADVRSESPQESAVRLRLLEAGFGGVCPQVKVVRPGGGVFRVDVAVLLPAGCGARGVAVEYSGEEFHPLVGEKRAQDCARREELESLGWRVVEVRGPDLHGLLPVFEQRVADLVRAAGGVAPPVGVREKWGLTKMNWLRNAWSRRREPWWRPWEGQAA